MDHMLTEDLPIRPMSLKCPPDMRFTLVTRDSLLENEKTQEISIFGLTSAALKYMCAILEHTTTEAHSSYPIKTMFYWIEKKLQLLNEVRMRGGKIYKSDLLHVLGFRNRQANQYSSLFRTTGKSILEAMGEFDKDCEDYLQSLAVSQNTRQPPIPAIALVVPEKVVNELTIFMHQGMTERQELIKNIIKTIETISANGASTTEASLDPELRVRKRFLSDSQERLAQLQFLEKQDQPYFPSPIWEDVRGFLTQLNASDLMKPKPKKITPEKLEKPEKPEKLEKPLQASVLPDCFKMTPAPKHDPLSMIFPFLDLDPTQVKKSISSDDESSWDECTTNYDTGVTTYRKRKTSKTEEPSTYKTPPDSPDSSSEDYDRAPTRLHPNTRRRNRNIWQGKQPPPSKS